MSSSITKKQQNTTQPGDDSPPLQKLGSSSNERKKTMMMMMQIPSPKKIILRWIIIIIFTIIISLIMMEFAYVINPLYYPSSYSSSSNENHNNNHHHRLHHPHQFTIETNLDPRIIRSSLTLSDSTLLIDVREPVEINRDGFHPSSILLPYSAIRRHIGKQMQHRVMVQKLVDFISDNDENIFDFIKTRIVGNFVELLKKVFVETDLEFVMTGYWEPFKNFFIDTLIFEPHHQLMTEIQNMENKKFKHLIEEVEFHPPKKIGFVQKTKKTGDYNFYGSLGPAYDRIKNARQVFVICSKSGWRSKVATHWLKSILISDNQQKQQQELLRTSTTFHHLPEHFVQLLPKDQPLYREWGFVRDGVQPVKEKESVSLHADLFGGVKSSSSSTRDKINNKRNTNNRNSNRNDDEDDDEDDNQRVKKQKKSSKRKAILEEKLNGLKNANNKNGERNYLNNNEHEKLPKVKRQRSSSITADPSRIFERKEEQRDKEVK